MSNKPTNINAQFEQNKAQFEQLCTEQDNLYMPEFESVFNALFEICPDQRDVYNTNGWDMGAMLPDEINTDVIKQALQTVGVDDKTAAKFIQYAKVTLQGKRLMQENAQLNVQVELAKQCNEPKQPDGWQFYPISILASPQLHTTINDAIENQAKTGKGVFENITKISEQPDVSLDELLGVDVYDIKCSFQPYLDELRQYSVTGTTFDKEITHCIFSVLKALADYIKENTTKPEAIKTFILDITKQFDDVPVWGLIFQIVILQGLCRLLENCTLKEGDYGYNEALGLYDWLQVILLNKLMRFVVTGAFYGDKDKERLQPLCDYLYNTGVGRAVQDYLFNQEYADSAGTVEPCLPPELDTPRARKYFKRAVDVEYMKKTDTGYKWLFGGERGRMARLGYFVEQVFCPNNTEKVPEQSINRLFGVSRICSAITQLHNAKKPQKWRAEIDKAIFYD